MKEVIYRRKTCAFKEAQNTANEQAANERPFEDCRTDKSQYRWDQYAEAEDPFAAVFLN
jgi:biotin synthase-related radical SAM superfamily protein